MQHTTNTTDTGADIHARAMLARVTISCWVGRRFDRQVTDDVNARHGAAREAGRFNKHLLGGRKAAPSHARACSAGAAARVEFYAQTLPWADEGWRLLPTANYDTFTDAMRARRLEFERAAETFLREYPALQSRARVLLNGLYREGEYPTVEQLRDRFSIGIEFAPVPAAGDFRLDLPADQLADIERTTASRVARATDDAMRDAWRRLRESVAKARAKLAEPKAIFRDSLIGNMRSVAEVLARLNVANDPGLEEMRARVAHELAALDPDSLRESPGARRDAVDSADSILARMSELYGAGQGGAR
jgi:hypothetical protein